MSLPVVPAEDLKAWLAGGAEGDEAACAALYHAFSPALFHLAAGLLGNLADAEDATQETFVYALRNLRRYRPERAAFNTWLYAIALSRCRNQRRRKTFNLLPLEAWVDQNAAAASREVELLVLRRGVRRDIWEALQQLPARLREAVALRFVAELKYIEIAQALGCNPKTAESRVRLGLVALRRILVARGVQAEMELAELAAG